MIHSSDSSDFLEVPGSSILALATDDMINIYAILTSPGPQLHLLSTFKANSDGYQFRLGSRNGRVVLYMDMDDGSLRVYALAASAGLPMQLSAEAIYPQNRTVFAISVSLLPAFYRLHDDMLHRARLAIPQLPRRQPSEITSSMSGPLRSHPFHTASIFYYHDKSLAPY